jgi:anti-sigma factor RsiW
MKALTCSAARRRLQAFYDEELSVSEQIAVSSHLEWCDECAELHADLGRVGATLRASMPGRVAFSSDEETNLQAQVVNRIKAEQTVSLAAQAREMFEDMRLIYAGVGGAAAAMVSVVIVLGIMMQFARVTKPGPLPTPPLEAHAIVLRPAPLPDPRVQMPRPLGAEISAGSDFTGDSVVMMVAVVTREGTVTDLSLLEPGGGRSSLMVTRTKAVENLMGAVSRARFEPARVDGLPVAMNMVWVVEHTTIRATPAKKKLTPSVRTSYTFRSA